MFHRYRLAVFVFLALLAIAAPTTSAQQGARSWWDRSRTLSTPHYRIRTDLPRAEARAVAGYLNDAHALYAEHFGTLRQRARKTSMAMVFQSRRDYENTLLARYGVDARGTGGMFFDTDDAAILAIWTDSISNARLRHVIQHEGFHQFAHGYFGDDLPMWVNEGLAEYFGASIPINNALVPGQAIGNGDLHVAAAVEEGRAIPFARMLEMRDSGWADAVRGGDPALLYEQAASMVRFLINGENKRYAPAFDRYLAFLNQTVPADDAFGRAFGGEEAQLPQSELIEQFEMRWKRFAKAPARPPIGTAYERLDFLASGMLSARKDGANPATIDELRAALNERGFSRTLDRHGHPITQSPDDAMFTLPDGTLIVEPAGAPSSMRERKLNDVNPMPPSIRTDGMHPRDLAVRWIRSEDNSHFRFEIVGE